MASDPLPRPFEPVVPHDVELPEVTVKAVVVGALVGVLFGAANAYLGLKVGLTVSASIPAAVIGVAIFRLFKNGSLLETNMVQTMGSAGESLAAGVIFTLPVLFLWGETPGFWPIFPLALLGGLLGVFFMIPLRRTLIVKEHGNLAFPEGTACAEVQVASQAGGRQGALLFGGMGIGMLYAAIEKFGHLWPAEPDIPVRLAGYRTSVGGDVTPELLGVGFIIGPRVAGVMLAGGVMGWLVIIPLIYEIGGAGVAELGSFDVWNNYVRYIGAGAVAFGGLFTLLKATPTMIDSIRLSVGALQAAKEGGVRRTERELPLSAVGVALVVIGLAVSFVPLMPGRSGVLGPLAGIAVVVFAFFFVTVSSRIVGLIGSSSNPISGMTIATVLVCALLFGNMYEGESARVAVLTIGALVAIAAAIAGDTSQDLKTGYLLGATPRRQQLGEIAGVVAAALAMSTVLALFREPIMSGEFKAPQANLIKLVIDGVLGGDLPWALVGVGAAMAFAVEVMGLPTLAFAVGLYLPIHLATPIMVGGLVRLAVDRSPTDADHRREVGVLVASGLIAGAAMVGVLGATLAFFSVEVPNLLGSLPFANARGLLAFAALTAVLAYFALGSPGRKTAS